MHASITALRVFSVVARTGSIVEAADSLGRTASAISMALKQLEAEVGAPLFESERKTRLTAVGRFMETQVRDLLEHYDRTLTGIAAFARNAIGCVDIACVPSVAMTLLPEVISRYRARWPEVEIDVRDADSRSVIEAVAAGTVEVGVASMRRSRPRLGFVPLFGEPLGIICRADDPLCSLPGPIPWSALEGRVLLANGIARALTDPEFGRLVGAAPIVVYNVLSLIALVQAGVGVTVLPRLAIARTQAEVAFLPVADPEAVRTVGLVTRSGETLSPAAATFIDLLREELAAASSRFGIDIA